MLRPSCAHVHLDLEICVAPHGVYFFDIATSKSGLRPSVFYTFDFEMCFAPQRRATFHLSSGQMAPAALVSLLFNPPEPQISGKNGVKRDFFFLPFRAPASSLRCLFLFSDLLFSSLLLSGFSHLCFSIFPSCLKFDF